MMIFFLFTDFFVYLIFQNRACILWQQSCGENGSCRLYNRENFMLTWLGIHLVYKLIGLLFWLGAILTYHPSNEEVKENDTKTEKISVCGTK